jgi:hypothetical protein
METIGFLGLALPALRDSQSFRKGSLRFMFFSSRRRTGVTGVRIESRNKPGRIPSWVLDKHLSRFGPTTRISKDVLVDPSTGLSNSFSLSPTWQQRLLILCFWGVT